MNSVCSDIGQLEFGDEFSSSDDDTNGRFVYVFNFSSEGVAQRKTLRTLGFKVNNCHFPFYVSLR